MVLVVSSLIKVPDLLFQTGDTGSFQARGAAYSILPTLRYPVLSFHACGAVSNLSALWC